MTINERFCRDLVRQSVRGGIDLNRAANMRRMARQWRFAKFVRTAVMAFVGFAALAALAVLMFACIHNN